MNGINPVRNYIMNFDKKVTIYITSHNYSNFLRESVDSVLSQTYNNWELFIIDDGSTDDSFLIMKEYAKSDKIFISRNITPKGLRNCANSVLEKATGEYIIRLDADDFFDAFNLSFTSIILCF